MAEDIKSLKSRRARITSLVRKEISTLFKDKMSLLILFLIPLVILLSVGMGEMSLFSDVEIPVYVLDLDDTAKSHAFVDTLRGNNLTVTVNREDNVTMTNEEFNRTAYELLPTNKLAAYIIIYNGFEEELENEGNTDKLEIHLDGIDFISKLMAQGMIQLSLVMYQLDTTIMASEIFYFPQFRPELEFTNLLQVAAPMILGILLFASINLVTSQSIVGDAPLKRLLTTPVFRSEVVIGKTIAYSIVSVFQILLSLIILRVFNVPMLGLFVDIFIVLWLTSLCGVSMGILFSAISRTRLQAAQMFLFGFIIMLIITMMIRIPIILPFLPIEQGEQAFVNLASRGMSLFEVGEQVLFLLLNAGIYLSITILYLKRKKEFV